MVLEYSLSLVGHFHHRLSTPLRTAERAAFRAVVGGWYPEMIALARIPA